MNKITVPEAAKIMGCDPQFLRLALQQERFGFGVAVRCRKRFAYYVNKQKFDEYLGRDSK